MSQYIGRTYGQASCGICGTFFTKMSGNSKYCSKTCSMKAHGETGIGLSPRPCKTCNQIIQYPTSQSQKFCESCIKERKREQNRIRAIEYRRSQGAKQIGETIHCADCGKEITRTTAIKQFCKSCVKKHDIQRTKRYLMEHPDKAKEWSDAGRDNYDFSGNRKVVLERDNFMCQVCGITVKDAMLHIHHIDGQGSTLDRGDRNNDPSNLITVCHSCHATIHNHARWKGLSLPDALEFAKHERVTVNQQISLF